MSAREERLIVSAAELTRLRVICITCGAALEFPLDNLPRIAAHDRNCPACDGELLRRRANQGHPLLDLQRALREIAAASKDFGVEFVVDPPPA